MKAALQTERLYLRQWQASDFAMFAQINADPEVMCYFPKVLSERVSNILATKCQQLIKDKGWGFWAVSLKGSARHDSENKDKFIGMVGLNQAHADMPFAPCVEMAWRLHKDYWGQGYATEAAKAALAFAFETLDLQQVVAFTALINQPSQRLMQKIGMTKAPDNFYHPLLSPNHRLAEQVLYRITQEHWLKAQDR